LFIHKLFGYRGVILFPWTANVFDKNEEESALTSKNTNNTLNKSNSVNTIESDGAQYDKLVTDEIEQQNGPAQRTKAKKLTYYQVLIDNRDIPYIRAQPESVTFLGGPQKNRSVYSIHGLDYVSQIDVLPYTSTEKVPIIHDLFDKFLMYDNETSST
jgi:polymerase delta-interacting protein 2